MDVLDVLDDGVGGDDAAMESRRASERSRKKSCGKASEMHGGS